MAMAEQPSNVAATLKNKPEGRSVKRGARRAVKRAARRFRLAGGPAETASKRQRHDRARLERGNIMGQAVPF